MLHMAALFLPLRWRLFWPCPGARRRLVAKWFIPGNLVLAGGSGASPEERRRAFHSQISVLLAPGDRRRLVVVLPMYLIAFLLFVSGVCL